MYICKFIYVWFIYVKKYVCVLEIVFCAYSKRFAASALFDRTRIK